jgi:hypothetical protein
LRREADELLRQCIADGVASGEKRPGTAAGRSLWGRMVATIMYSAVRKAGGPCVAGLPSSALYRWGYGVIFNEQTSPRGS